MGTSSKPLMRYSTSEMAHDLLEVLNHLRWTTQRSLHVCGLSMGGMIAQELACLVPERICTLNLWCTAAQIEKTTTFADHWTNRIILLLPKSINRSIQYTAKQVFTPDYLSAPDSTMPPDESTPRCKIPPGGYLKFRNNYERFAAQEIAKQADKEGFQKKGFLRKFHGQRICT